MTEATRQPFNREESLDEPGIIGARWWQRSLETPADAMSRRSALTGILVATGAIAGVGMLFAVTAGSSSSSSSSSDDTRTENRNALEMQKQYGWSFGAVTDSLTFDGDTLKPFDRSALARMPDDFRPTTGRHTAWFVPTLFQSPAALPTTTPAGDAGTLTPLKDALKPIFTTAMDKAYRRGRALASLFKGLSTTTAVIVDLPGPEAVAFAAGAAGVLEPVFLFDNWPHPRGVVPAHLTLAAAAYYQPLFAKKKAPPNASALFVLDRARLNAYSDDSTQFDNRHVARLPSASQMKSLGYTHLLYVGPLSSDPKELDDLNDDFVIYKSQGIDVRFAGADAFGPDPSDSAPASRPPDEDEDPPRYYYGSRSSTHYYFWIDYPWAKDPRAKTAPTEPSFARPGASWTPRARATPFSSGAPSLNNARTRPPGFGTVPVVVSIATGLILGAKLSRNGSWNRTSGWGGG